MRTPTPGIALALARLAFAGAALSLASLVHAQQPAKDAKAGAPLKIVLHVSDPDGMLPALSNVKNLAAQGPSVKLRVVVDGSGVYMLQGNTNITPLFQKYADLGVEFQACHNALGEHHIAPASLPRGIKVVPMGVLALAEAQASGYAYVKP